MNAYELADDLENSNGLQYITKVGLVSLSAKMLRQQADRIERKRELIREQTALLVKQNNRIAELERLVSDMIYEKASGVYQGKYLEQYWVKQQSAEPVAWWTGKFEDESEDFMFAKTRQAHIDHAQSCTYEFFPIPLYTTPKIKELSDEEIWEVIDNCFGVHAFNLDYQIALDEAREDAFDLVKTILKKASEK